MKNDSWVIVTQYFDENGSRCTQYDYPSARICDSYSDARAYALKDAILEKQEVMDCFPFKQVELVDNGGSEESSFDIVLLEDEICTMMWTVVPVERRKEN